MGNSRCILKKNRAIGAQENFADTFNWLVKFCDNLTGEEGIEVDKGDENHPKIRLKKEEDEGDGEGNGNGIIYNFVPENDNVKINVEDEEDGSKTVTIGVYYV